MFPDFICVYFINHKGQHVSFLCGKALSVAEKPSNLSGSLQLLLCLWPLLLWFASSTCVLSAPPCKQGRMRMGLMADYTRTPHSCWQTANRTYGSAHHKTMSYSLPAHTGFNRAAEYTSIIGVLIWHCCVNWAVKSHRPTIPSWRLMSLPGSRWSVFLLVIWQKCFHWALTSTLSHSLFSPTKSPNCAVQSGGKSS